MLKLRLARARLTSHPEATADLLEDAARELDTGLRELREIARGLHPAILGEQGLLRALEALAEGLPVPVDIEADPERLPEHVEATAYYIVSEALTNVAKHAAATRARVSVQRDGAVLRCEVSDDGRGGADTARRHRHPRPARPRRGRGRDAVARQPAGARDRRDGGRCR